MNYGHPRIPLIAYNLIAYNLAGRAVNERLDLARNQARPDHAHTLAHSLSAECRNLPAM